VQETGDISLTPTEQVDNSPALRCRVVVADDSTDLRDLFVLILDDEDDFTVIGSAADGAEAVQLADELEPDLLVLDVNMPVMDGIEALRRVKATQPQIRVVLLSAFPPGVLPRDDVALADDYLEKGVGVTTLVERLRATCRRPMQAQ
jgi:DNA-binding NarL/FixJ family response regulator